MFEYKGPQARKVVSRRCEPPEKRVINSPLFLHLSPVRGDSKRGCLYTSLHYQYETVLFLQKIAMIMTPICLFR